VITLGYVNNKRSGNGPAHCQSSEGPPPQPSTVNGSVLHRPE